MKKIVAFLLLITCFTSFFTFPSFAASVSNGVQFKINKLLEVYDNDSFFTADGKACEYSCSNCLLSEIPKRDGLPAGKKAAKICGDAYSCVAFARYAFYYIYGTSLKDASTPDTVSFGDYVSLNNGKHAAIYLDEDDDYIYVYNSNGDYVCGVEYYQAFSKKKWFISNIYHAENYDDIYYALPDTPSFSCVVKDNNVTVKFKECNYSDWFNVYFYNASGKLVYSKNKINKDFKTSLTNGKYYVKVSAVNKLTNFPVYSKNKKITVKSSKKAAIPTYSVRIQNNTAKIQIGNTLNAEKFILNLYDKNGRLVYSHKNIVKDTVLLSLPKGKYYAKLYAVNYKGQKTSGKKITFNVKSTRTRSNRIYFSNYSSSLWK